MNSAGFIVTMIFSAVAIAFLTCITVEIIKEIKYNYRRIERLFAERKAILQSANPCEVCKYNPKKPCFEDTLCKDCHKKDCSHSFCNLGDKYKCFEWNGGNNED